jgi:diacylglycerol kinase family enzyme
MIKSMNSPTSVVIIYNPNSTGNGKENAVNLQAELEGAGLPTILLRETEYAGHAIEISKELADENDGVMIISSSGDGGYHEVINGVLASNYPDTLVGVLPSGNANDHWNFVHEGDTAKRIMNGENTHIDLIKVVTPQWTRYAHSYVGLGMTPQIGKELTKAKLNLFNETWLVLTNLFRVRPVKIRMNGRVARFDHIVFSNIGRMSKYLTLAKDASVTDGIIELNTVKSESFITLIRHLVHAATIGNDDARTASKYEFTVLRNTPIQLDGEVYRLKRGETIMVECASRALNCIV